MRTKCDIRRQTIVDTAAQVFQQSGFDNTSMAEISARVGGSKATLYSYFPSKEALFIETIRQSAEHDICEIFKALNQTQDNIDEALRAFGCAFIRQLVDPRMISVKRMVYAAANQNGIGKDFYERCPQRGELAMVSFLENAMDKKLLARRDPITATRHLRALLESPLVERALLCVADTISDEEIAKSVDDAIRVFLAAYRNP